MSLLWIAAAGCRDAKKLPENFAANRDLQALSFLVLRKSRTTFRKGEKTNTDGTPTID
jgi:hypothetical protein